MSDKPIVARTKDGAEYGFPGEAAARDQLGDAFDAVTRFQDGTALDAPSEKPLREMTRDELNAKAASVGIEDPASLPNKDAVIAAIEGAA